MVSGIRNIVSKDGIKGFYKGISSAYIFELGVSTIRLGAYEPIKQLLGATDPHNTPLITKIVAGGLAAAPGVVTSPFDMIKVRM
jgi:hypothetical protein